MPIGQPSRVGITNALLGAARHCGNHGTGPGRQVSAHPVESVICRPVTDGIREKSQEALDQRRGCYCPQNSVHIVRVFIVEPMWGIQPLSDLVHLGYDQRRRSRYLDLICSIVLWVQPKQPLSP